MLPVREIIWFAAMLKVTILFNAIAMWMCLMAVATTMTPLLDSNAGWLNDVIRIRMFASLENAIV